MSKTYDAALWRKRAAEFGAERGVDLELPSGMVVRAVRPDPETWMLHGRLPTSLAAAIKAAKDNGAAEAPSDDQILAFGRFYHDVIVTAVVRPRIVAADPGDGEIAYAEIPGEDLDFIYKWATRQAEVADLASFRAHRRDAGAGDHGQDLRPAAKPAGRRRG